MKRVVILLTLLAPVFSLLAQQDREIKGGYIYRTEYSADSTMVYNYIESYFGYPFVEVCRADYPVFSDSQFTDQPWWFGANLKFLKSHWETYGKEVYAILEELKIAKRSLLVRLIYSLRTGDLVGMKVAVNHKTMFLLDKLPLKEIFSIFESVDTTRFITINNHEPCEADNKYIAYTYPL